ncbi:MAG: hypothetical protein GC178_12385 [Flavobacteriales bacterium]|nr:hypothetical protein [Flavobacteriales bacterium]
MPRFITTVLCVIVLVQSGFSHDPNLATFTISQKKGVWILEMSCAQEGLDRAMRKFKPEVAKLGFSDRSYKEAVVEYLKSTIFIQADDFAEVTLGQGAIKLGAHQSNVKFELSGMPDSPKRLKLRLASMSENPEHVSLVKVFLPTELKRFLLDKNNHFEVAFEMDRKDATAD